MQQNDPDFPLGLLTLVAGNDDLSVRQAAATYFKNTTKIGWGEQAEISIREQDKQTIKSHLVQLMCSVPRQIQAMLCESIALIAAVDYPKNWNNLLPEMIQSLNNPDPHVKIGILKTADSIFVRFRDGFRSDELYAVIKYTLEGLQVPLTALFKSTGQTIQTTTDVNLLKLHFEILALIVSIFYSLNFQDLPEYFEDNMGEWMSHFSSYLSYHNPALEDADEETQPSCVDTAVVGIILILDLYASKDEEVFVEKYLSQFTTLVWDRLIQLSPLPKHDNVATSSIKFLSSLIQKPMHRSLFASETVLRQIITKIVIPNLTFRESDEEKFEDDPHEFIVTEVEGADSDSRRRTSQFLLKAMCRNFETEATQICAEHVTSMLSDYSKNPNQQWKAKDAAINLMMGIAVRRSTETGGVSEVNPQVNVLDFFQSQILSELQDTNHGNRPVVKATALKFVSVFRNQFTREHVVQLMPVLIGQLSSPVVVVHTFAAFTIERLLYTKQQEQSGGGKVLKIRSTELGAFIEQLFNGLFAIIDNTQWVENDYAMKCVMRSLATAGDTVIPITETVLTKLTAALERVAANPRVPVFNHCLFESIAILVRTVCSKDPTATATMEPLLFAPFNVILQKDITEFTPYVFQVLAQLLEYRPAGSGLGQAYTALFVPLLTPIIWENRGNIPALVRLLQAYVQKGPSEIASNLQGILGIFQKLLSMGSYEVYGLDLLSSVLMHFPQETLHPMFGAVFNVLLRRLQGKQDGKYKRNVSVVFSLFAGKFGSQAFNEVTGAMQGNLSVMLIKTVWAPVLKSDMFQRTEAKIHAVGMGKMLFENPTIFSSPEGLEAWATGVLGLVAVLSSPAFQTTSSGPTEDYEIQTGFDAKFSKLNFAHKVKEDPFPDVTDPRQTFARSLHSVLTSHAAQLQPLMQQCFAGEEKLQAGLSALFEQYGISM